MTDRAPLHPMILVVEDDPANRELVVRLLSSRDYVVESVTDGEAALAAVTDARFDLILLDVRLPGVDGFDVCRAIKGRAATRLTPVVLVTGLHDRQHKISGIEAGADGFLSKPFDEEELTARVASLVRLKRYTDDLESAESVIFGLAQTVEARDPYTGEHCQRLAAYATARGAQLQLHDDQIAALRRGGYGSNFDRMTRASGLTKHGWRQNIAGLYALMGANLALFYETREGRSACRSRGARGRLRPLPVTAREQNALWYRRAPELREASMFSAPCPSLANNGCSTNDAAHVSYPWPVISTPLMLTRWNCCRDAARARWVPSMSRRTIWSDGATTSLGAEGAS